MSIKKLALIAATLAATASTASASNYFGIGENRNSGTTLEVGLVRAETAGVVEHLQLLERRQRRIVGHTGSKCWCQHRRSHQCWYQQCLQRSRSSGNRRPSRDLHGLRYRQISYTRITPLHAADWFASLTSPRRCCV